MPRSPPGKSREDPFWHFAVITALDTGLRLGDIAQLEWTAFAETGKITVVMDKTNKPVTFKTTPRIPKLIGEPEAVYPPCPGLTQSDVQA